MDHGPSGQTTPLAALHDPNAHSTAICNQILAYWLSLMQGSQIPRRSDLVTSGLTPALDHLFVAERIAAGKLRIRQAGDHLVQLTNTDLRGTVLSDLIDPADHTAFALAAETIMQWPATLDASLVATHTRQAKAISARLLLLPLRSDLGDVSRVVGCFVSTGAGRLQNCRFRIQDYELRSADLRNQRISLYTSSRQNPSLPYRHTPKSYDHLRLVHSK